MKLHPLNEDFSWQPPTGALNYLSPQQVRAYNEQGGFVLPDVFSATEVADLLRELDPLEAESNAALQGIDPIRASQRSRDLMKLCSALTRF